MVRCVITLLVAALASPALALAPEAMRPDPGQAPAGMPALPLTPAPSPVLPGPVSAQPSDPAVPAAGGPARPKAVGKPVVAKPTVAKPDAPVAKPVPIPEPVKVSADPRPTLGPETFVSTMKAADRYRGIVESGGWPTVPNEATRLKPGDAGPAIAELRRRLVIVGDLADQDRGQTFDATLVAALKRFQFRHGLEETGLVGPQTLVELNVPAETRLRQLQASAARLIGSKFGFGDRYVAVNIPSATVEAIDHGTVMRRYVAVVGKPDRPSPLVETRVTSVNFNPTWTVPVSLIRKDIIPHVRKDPNYLAKMRIRLFDQQGVEIDPGTIDWSTERAVNYTIRQDSGVANSLGEVRIDMPNRHSVYMHDTPSKRLFARTSRAQSSGCVRVAGVKGLVAWLLEGTAGPSGTGLAWTPTEIDAAIARGTRMDARLAKPIPVAWVYLTGYGMPDGTAHFRPDIYGLDAPNDPQPAPDRSGLDALVTSSITPLR